MNTMKAALLAIALVMVLSAPAVAQDNPTVYRTSDGSIYHTADCQLLKSRQPIPVTLSEAQRLGLTPCSLCKPPKAEGFGAGTDAAYLISALATARAKPEPAAAVVGTLKPFTIVELIAVTPGWVRVNVPQGQGKAPLPGWIAGSKENILPDSVLAATLRQVQASHTEWTQAVKADVIRGRPRIGFTAEQVSVALGDPISKGREETATGVTEKWVYRARIVTFKAGHVTAITTVE